MLTNPSQKYAAFAPIALPNRTWPDAVISRAPRWLSTDLRDGNQSLIEPMDAARKLRMFELLVRIGFKEIEVGFPSASQTDFDFVRLLIDEDLIPADVTIQVLTPARDELIRRTFESLQGAKRVIVHLYNAVSPIMREVVLGLDKAQTVQLAVVHAELIKELASEQSATHWTFQYSPEHFSGTELAFNKEVVDAVTAVWQPTPEHKCIINLPATVEYSTPNIYADMIEWMHRHMARRESIVLSVHPHNDRGTGTAAAEFAIMAGADRVEGCLFGSGERTGNLDLVNVALNLYTQGVSPQLDFSDIDEIRRAVEHCNRLPLSPRHPYVGELVYTSFSGSHQDAIKKAFARAKPGDRWAIPYLPIDPKDVGRSYEAVIRVNSQSGKGGIAYLLETEYGLSLPRRLQIEFSQAVQAVSDASGGELLAADIWRVFKAEYLSAKSADEYIVHQLSETAADGVVHINANVIVGGARHTIKGQGNGPIEAFVGGLERATGAVIRVLDYHEHAVAAGAGASAVAYLELSVNGKTLFGVGMDANIVAASMKAILSGVERANVVAEIQQKKIHVKASV
jgi:2-isopropylmalate synthase